MRSFILILACVLISIATLAQEDCTNTNETAIIDSILFNATPKTDRSPASLNNGSKEYQRGCCSWHNGVCGCAGGSVLCCDGQYSPSCGC